MSTPIFITTDHNGVLVTYDEYSNTWKFTLRNRDRSAESLAKAKEIIDKPGPKEKEKAFQKMEAWWIPYEKPPRRVTVTGIAEGIYSRDKLWVWIKDARGNRSKEQADFTIYPSTPENDATVTEILNRDKQIQKLKTEIEDLRSTLQPLKLEIPE